MCPLLLSLTLLSTLYLSVVGDMVSSQDNCSCGFYDHITKELYTDSIVVYFNESKDIPIDFMIEHYEHKYEQDWNSIYRQGADPSNVKLNAPDSLELFVSPPTKTHLVKGGSVRTVREDIQHGSFRSFIRSPRANHSGSTISMGWRYNETESKLIYTDTKLSELI